MFAARQFVWAAMRAVAPVAGPVLLCLVMSPVAPAQSSALASNVPPRMQQVQKDMAAEARQKKMETDAAKLVEMAQGLKTSVDKTNKDVLSVDVINRAAQIEKLAREVREGMRQ